MSDVAAAGPGTNEGRRPRVFVSYSYADLDAARVRDLLRSNFDVSTIDTTPSATTRHTALFQALGSADVAVAVMPPFEDPARRNILLEVGAAIGAGVPLLVVGDGSDLPVDLQDLFVARIDSPDVILASVSGLAQRGRRPSAPPPKLPQESGIPIESLDAIRQELSSPGLSGAAAAKRLADLFVRAGAITVRSDQDDDPLVPDLAIWHDQLTATLGTPLPVEVLARSNSWPAVLSRLQRTLSESGGRTLLAISLEPSTSAPRLWSDGQRTILFASAGDLIDSLSSESLPAALASLLERAAP